MESTRITVVLEIDHEPDLELPRRAALFLERTLSELDGFGAVEVIKGEVGPVEWTPLRMLKEAG